MNDGERLARLTLARADRVGPVAFRQLIARFGSAARAVEALPDLARRGGARDYTLPEPRRIEAELAGGDRLGARLLTALDEGWPRMLAALDAPPPLLWLRGDAALLNRPSVAVVGARVASAAGCRIALGLARQLGVAGHVVVSGLARGIDAAAHQGALESGTVAVLAGGVDDVYPAEHDDLYRRIVEIGAVVSESPVGARATARDFPRRNRIISGLSRGVIVVEAEIRSGSLITAGLAAEQGRDVFAVPGSPLDPRARGPNDLLRNGAILCEGIEDVARAFETLRRLDDTGHRVEWDVVPDEVDSDAMTRVAALLSPTPVSRDDLARAAGLSASETAAALLELSLAGRAALLSGDRVCAA